MNFLVVPHVGTGVHLRIIDAAQSEAQSRAFLHPNGQEVDFAMSVATEDGQGQCIEEVTECIEPPLLLLNGNAEQAKTFQRQLVLLRVDCGTPRDGGTEWS